MEVIMILGHKIKIELPVKCFPNHNSFKYVKVNKSITINFNNTQTRHLFYQHKN